MGTQKKSPKLFTRTHFYLFLLGLSLLGTIFTVSNAVREQQTRSNAQTASFTFTAAGDYGMDGNFTNTLNTLGSTGANFNFVLGGLAFTAGKEQEWCNTIKAKNNNTVFIAGDHETGESDGGNVDLYVPSCPFTLGTMTGDYGKQYYFDYPQTNPIARFIAISPGLNTLNYNYGVGGNGYSFTAQAIDTARSQGIKWIIVGMHKDCITVGQKTCEIGKPLMDMLVQKRADIILQAHDRNYQRTHMLKCFQELTFDVSCVIKDGTDGVYNYGEGSVILIAGTGGKPLDEIKTVDGEQQYFAKAQADTWGVLKFTVNQTTLTGQFLPSAGASTGDYFYIGDPANAAPSIAVPSNPPLSIAPTSITPTIYCVGGVGAPPCAPLPTELPLPTGTPGTVTPSTGSTTPPVGGANPTTAPNPGTNPCTNTNASEQTGKHKYKHKHGRGRSGGFIEAFFRFLLQLLELLLQRMGVGPGPSPCPPSTITPTGAPVVQPTTNPGTPSNPVAPTAPVGGGVGGQPTAGPGTTAAPSQGVIPSGSPVAVGKTVLFTANYNSGTIAPWNTAVQCPPTRETTVVTDFVREGTHAVRFKVAGGGCDNQHQAILRSTNAALTTKEGDERWYEWSMRADETFTYPQGTRNYFNVLQWGDDSDSAALAVVITNDGMVQVGGEGVPNTKKPIIKIQKGAWIDYVLHVKFSTNASTGFVEAWANGTQTIPKTSRKTLSGASQTLHVGIDRDDANLDIEHIIWQDNFRITAP